MAIEEVHRIKRIFQELGITPTYLEHQPVITSEEAARSRGFELKQGIKALLFTNEEEWIIVDLPADRKVDQKSVAALLGWSKSKIRMATPEEVVDKTGCEIGAVPPFGHKEHIPILVDIGIYDNKESAFNIGLRTHSVKIKTALMRMVFEKVKAKEGKFST